MPVTEGTSVAAPSGTTAVISFVLEHCCPGLAADAVRPETGWASVDALTTILSASGVVA